MNTYVDGRTTSSWLLRQMPSIMPEDKMNHQQDAFASSTGHVFSDADFLDAHFEVARPEYEAQLRAVGIQLGWYALDAACGSGPFLPWMAELVGPNGRLSTLDLDPENVALVERRLAGWQFDCPVEAQVGSVVELLYPDNTFDAIWLANTSEYLTDEELDTTLAEFRRVVRPGGLVALKESDTTMYSLYPAPPGLILRYAQASAHVGDVQQAGGVRAPALPGRLRQAGLVDVWQRSKLIERAAPFDAVTRAFWSGGLAAWSRQAVELDLPAADLGFWEQMRDPDGRELLLSDPDCCIIEGNLLTVGTVPMDVEHTSLPGRLNDHHSRSLEVEDEF